MKNLLVAQSGGPSAAINATLCGVVEKGLMEKKINKIYGAKNGIMGVFSEDFIELQNVLASPDALQLLCQTPASALGSCRIKLKDVSEYERIIEILRKHDIGYFIYIGGNDSMDTVHKLAQFCESKGIDDIKIVGAPKTIDNDLVETDHTPGFGSAAKYIATTFSEMSCDCNVYTTPAVTVVEIMGRDAGWLTASSALARLNGGFAPDLIYLCEKPFVRERFVDDVRAKLAEKPAVVIAVSEGIKDENGEYVSEGSQNEAAVDAFGHKALAGAARYLESVLRNEIGCKVRCIELNVVQRCASHVASATDIYESRMLGMAAADYALSGGTGRMAALRRVSTEPYRVEIDFMDIAKIANQVKTVPDAWINEAGNDVTQEMIDYLLPLIQGEQRCTYKNGVPVHLRLY